MRVRHEPVTAFRLDTPLTLTLPGGDVEVPVGDWIVADSVGMMYPYQHEHFVRVFAPDDEESRETWSALGLLGEQPG